jgi:hypothetical protein
VSRFVALVACGGEALTTGDLTGPSSTPEPTARTASMTTTEPPTVMDAGRAAFEARTTPDDRRRIARTAYIEPS